MAGERCRRAGEKGQEDEHSCFSDTTKPTWSKKSRARMVYTGDAHANRGDSSKRLREATPRCGAAAESRGDVAARSGYRRVRGMMPHDRPPETRRGGRHRPIEGRNRRAAARRPSTSRQLRGLSVRAGAVTEVYRRRSRVDRDRRGGGRRHDRADRALSGGRGRRHATAGVCARAQARRAPRRAFRSAQFFNRNWVTAPA